jgi:hypothetical protein
MPIGRARRVVPTRSSRLEMSVARRGRTRDEVEWRAERDEWLAFDTVLEFGHESGEVGENPGVHVGGYSTGSRASGWASQRLSVPYLLSAAPDSHRQT